MLTSSLIPPNLQDYTLITHQKIPLIKGFPKKAQSLLGKNSSSSIKQALSLYTYVIF